ncbi:oligosaccharide flippase family protein [Corynebacterium sp. S7]
MATTQVASSQSDKGARVLVTLSMLSNAFSKWFLVWLFARTAGGAEAVGTYSLVLAVGTPIFVVAQMGLRMIIVSLERTRPWSYYIYLRWIGVILGAVVLLGYGVVSDSVPFSLVAAVTLLKVCDSFDDITYAKLQYFNQMRTIGSLGILFSWITVVVSAILVYFFGSVEIAVVGAAIIAAVSALVGWKLSTKFEFEREDKDGAFKDILRAAVPITGADLLGSLLFQIPVLIVGALGDPESVGVFATAAYLLTLASLLGAAVQNVVITPFRILRKEAGAGEIQRRIGKMGRQLMVLSAIAIVVVIAFGSDVLVLIYGDQFAIDTLPLTFMAFAAAATIIAYIYSVTLNVFNRYGAVTWSFLLACILTVVASLIAHLAGADAILAGSVGIAGGAFTRLIVLWASTRIEVRKLEAAA